MLIQQTTSKMAKGNFYIYVQCTCSASYITSYLYINFRGMVNACYLNAYFMLDWKHLEILDFFPIPRTYESFQNQGKPPFCKTFWYTRGVVYVPYPKYNELQCRHCKMRVRKRLNAAMNCGSRKSRAYSTEALYLMVIYGTNCLLLFQHSNSTLSSS